MKIYHNARCSKSRKTLSLLKSKTADFEIVEYLKNPLNIEEVKIILSKLNIKPVELIRVQEAIWKENYQTKNMEDDEIINIITKYPKLMQRPIVTTNKKAIIGRPPEKVLDLFTQEFDQHPTSLP
ncbi:MAG: arsenate reductase (glutaredoxin) [Bacteroidota bacterium]|nr:arsenate reductase (glutaredoxin) [Bacteroidota bacterium]|tara:strand:+ start:238 stop:612 length:375 start_codon:yes stop_codon:yes gene_type:complete